jgi:hypothetical protein
MEKICSVCWTDDYIIVAKSDWGGFFFENEEEWPKQYCDYCFELAHWGDTSFCKKKKDLFWFK